MNFYYYSLLVFLTGMLGIWKAVPVGVALGLDPVMTWLMTSAGAVLAATVLYFLGERIRTFLEKKRKKSPGKKQNERAARLLEKYGIPGLGFLGCLLMGPNMTILVGLVLVRSNIRLLYWTIAGILVWSLALTSLAVISIDLFTRLVE